VSTHYARRSRKPSRRALEDRTLVVEIHAARAGYRQVHGVRKSWKELRRRDVEVGRERVARLMRHEGLEGVRRGKKNARRSRRGSGRTGARQVQRPWLLPKAMIHTTPTMRSR
jgi:putative transposase